MALVPVGLIFLEDYNGGVVGQAYYDVPSMIRERSIVLRKIRYEQNRRTPDGYWVYRAVEPAHEGDTLELKHIDFAKEASEPVPTWADIEKWFRVYTTGTEPVPIGKVRDLEGLIRKVRENGW